MEGSNDYENMTDDIEMNSMTDKPTSQQPRQYQPLQKEQRNRDSTYHNMAKPEQIMVDSESDYEHVSVPSPNAQPPNMIQSPEKAQKQKEKVCEGLSKGEAGRHDINKTMKKMKIVLLVTVIVNIVMLLLIIILGGILIQSRFEQVTSRIDELTASTEENTIGNISKLTMETYNNISLVSLQLTSTLNQLDTNQGYITTRFEAAYNNITFVQSKITDLQLQLYCGPGEWHQVGYLNMSDPSQQCPSTWREYNTSGVRACGRPNASEGSCADTSFSINLSYKRVCGRVVGYQFGTPDAFFIQDITNERYVDGISITRGSSHEHVWTYAAGVRESSAVQFHTSCPCSSNPGRAAPSFVGDNYFCESGNPNDTFENRLYTSDKLWDGIQCEGSCCTGTNTPPWFSVQLSTTTSDDIEIRICGDEGTDNEDTPVELIEIYAFK